MAQYTVVACPAEALAKTNKAFVAPTDRASGRYLLINNHMILVADGHPGILPGQLGLNALHRKYIRVSNGDTTSAVAVPPEQMDRAVLVTLEIGYLGKKKAAPQDMDAQELSARFQKCFLDQVINGNLEVSMELMGVNYLIKAVSILKLDAKGEQIGVPRALLMPETAFVWDANSDSNIKIINQRAQAANQLFKHTEFNFQKLGIGGLDKQFDAIFRRAFASRVFPPSVVERLGIKHVRGVLLYGPPGTGKTLIARQIGKMLNGKEPKVVNGPEVLSKFVGESEENVRKLFADAEADQKTKGDASDLHVIIFDELDSICKQRGSTKDGTGVHDSLVNQLLSKIDGVDSLNNILLIGMTNRKDMLDEALMRPGRLEVQIEIGLPDEEGRLQILKIHTSRMETNSFLATDVELEKLAELTKNYSGAEIEGLCKSAASYALNRHVDVNDLSKPIDEDNIKVMMSDFLSALDEVRPAFGSQTEDLEARRPHGIIDYGTRYQQVLKSLRMLVDQMASSEKTSLLTCLLEGPAGSGKTALAATIGLESECPFAKIISAETMVGYSEMSKIGALAKVFDDAYKSPASIIILDDIERLLEFVAIGPRFSNMLLQTLLVLLKRPPPAGHRVLVIGTTSQARVMEELDVASVFNVILPVPALKEAEMKAVFTHLGAFAPSEMDMAVTALMDTQVPIKRLLTLLDLAQQSVKGAKQIPGHVWAEVLSDLRA